MELLFCLMVAWLFVKDTAVDGWAMAKGQKPPRHTERMARRQQEHERRLAAMKHRSAERVAGVGGPTVREAFAERLRKGPKSRDDMHGPRAWWFDLCADRAEEMTRERRARKERQARGEEPYQRAGRWLHDWYRRTGERAEQRWRDRNQPRDPHRRWDDEEVIDADWWDSPPGGDQSRRPDPRAPGRPGPESAPEPGGGETMSCRGCGRPTADLSGRCHDCTARRPDGPQLCTSCGRYRAWGVGICAICRNAQTPPDHTADPPPPAPPRRAHTHGPYQFPPPPSSYPWERWSPGPAPANPDDPPATVRAVAERIPEPPDGRPVEPINQGALTMSQPVPAQGANGVALAEASADMTAANATAFAGTAARILRMTVQAYEEAIADLASNKKVSGPALVAFQQAASDLESAVLNTEAGGRVTAEHEVKADEYRDYQATTGSGDAKTYAELH